MDRYYPGLRMRARGSLPADIQTQMSDRRNRRSRVLVGLILLGGFLVQCQQALRDQSAETPQVLVKGPAGVGDKVAFASPAPEQPRATETLEQRAARDPVGFIEDALEQYDRTVRDYTCTFTKQELVGGSLTKEQVMRAMFREKPFSVRLEWTRNADKCERVLYVADRWIEKGQQMAVVEPGWLARTFVSHVLRPIHGPDAKKSSRRTLDQFGLRNSLSLTLKYIKRAEELGKLDFSYQGKGEVDRRESLVFERRLPYTGEDGPWPDRVLVVHIDKELMLPLLCLCYADDEKQVLLGKYMTTDIKLNVNLSDTTFSKEGMGIQ